MLTFDSSITINAPLERVLAFHQDARVLKVLTPPPTIVQMHRFEPMAEGAVAEFTLWFGPLPVRWVAIHSDVSSQGFTDTLKDGLFKYWRHTHTFTAEGPNVTRITDHIEYDHRSDPRGILSRLLFPPPALTFAFKYRKWALQTVLER